jgi:hypothetical protein
MLEVCFLDAKWAPAGSPDQWRPDDGPFDHFPQYFYCFKKNKAQQIPRAADRPHHPGLQALKPVFKCLQDLVHALHKFHRIIECSDSSFGFIPAHFIQR